MDASGGSHRSLLSGRLEGVEAGPHRILTVRAKRQRLDQLVSPSAGWGRLEVAEPAHMTGQVMRRRPLAIQCARTERCAYRGGPRESNAATVISARPRATMASAGSGAGTGLACSD